MANFSVKIILFEESKKLYVIMLCKHYRKMCLNVDEGFSVVYKKKACFTIRFTIRIADDTHRHPWLNKNISPGKSTL